MPSDYEAVGRLRDIPMATIRILCCILSSCRSLVLLSERSVVLVSPFHLSVLWLALLSEHRYSLRHYRYFLRTSIGSLIS